MASEKTEAVYKCQVGEDGDDEGEGHVVKDYVVDAIVMMTLMVMVPGEDDEEDEDHHDCADAIAGPLS